MVRSIIQRAKTVVGVGQHAEFEKFRNRYYSIKGRGLRGEEAVRFFCAARKFDVLVSGSDQIWNPAYTHEDGVFFLSFADSRYRKISYASSFGTKALDDLHGKIYGQWLHSFAAISVRELSAVEIVKKISGKPCRQILDPTMLIDGQEWLKLSEKSIIKKPYLLSFCLRYIFDPYPYADILCNAVANRKGLARETIWNMKYEPSAHVHRSCSVGLFLSLMANASHVVTTSFHGTVFAILFHRPFTVIQRSGSLDSRLRDLLRLLGLEHRIAELPNPADMSKDSVSILANVDLGEIDYTSVAKKIRSLRSDALNWLQANLYGGCDAM